MDRRPFLVRRPSKPKGISGQDALSVRRPFRIGGPLSQEILFSLKMGTLTRQEALSEWETLTRQEALCQEAPSVHGRRPLTNPKSEAPISPDPSPG